MSQKRLKFLALLLISILTVVIISFVYPRQQQTVELESNYAIHARQDFNQPSFYPITLTAPNNLYRPTGAWVGRLILPTPQQMQDGADWVWMEVEYAPPTAQKLVGKIVRLEWTNDQDTLSYVKAVTRDVNFTPETIKSQQKGIIHPSRLNGIHNVGALRSLAGARPKDDVIVTLDNATVINEGVGKVILQITHEPVLAVGRFYGLVKIIEPDKSFKTSRTNPQYFRVAHYNPASGNFDGTEGTVRIPQQVVDTRNIAPSTPLLVEKSHAGDNGWYIYGTRDSRGIFTVQALAPRSLFQIQPNELIANENAAIKYIQTQHWRNTPAQKGKINTVFLNSDVLKSTSSLPYQGGLVGFQNTSFQEQTLNSPSASLQPDPLNPPSSPLQASGGSNLQNTGGLGGYQWQQGDKAILLHLFGGIGGRKAEALGIPATITGHFAFGIAQVIRDSFTNELRFDIKYHQIYAHNPDGIVSGTHTWADYMGNLQRGWLSTRPVSDILIKFDPVTQDYDFDGIKLSPLKELQRQLQIMMARYRIGDGTGGATVSPATSCVQDSAQALYATIITIKNQVAATPQIQQWLKAHPDDPQTVRFEQLVSLGAELDKQLAPLGVVRADWQSSTSMLAGTGAGKNSQPFRDVSIWAGLTTWRTMMPRQVHDDLASIFLRHGGSLQILRTNQVGGWQADIEPLAPTILFGQIKIPFTEISPLPIVINRILASLKIPTQQDGFVIGTTLFIYSLIALPIGLKSRFLQLQIWPASYLDKALLILRCLFLPAISEELFFRVVLIPHPMETTNWLIWILAVLLSLVLFIIYHPINGKTFFKQAHTTFFNRIFLFLATLLGIACTIAYVVTGSFFVIVMIHWIVVVVWLIAFGGIKQLNTALLV
ncbi:MAG: CPBP family intramembrane metalloprotease [Calothrix sp. C42_A2020_038]|nr:CPBP family intramembrane metalloprotease [Calothrix sp. C42_A2020_038]